MADTTRSEQNQPKQPHAGSGQTTEQTASAARQARGYMPDMERQMGQTAQRAKERVSEAADQARETINQAYTRASRGMNDTWDQAMDYSKDHPATATLIAFGAGVGIGLFLAGGFQSRSRTRRIVPPVMNAISEIAREFFR